MKKRLRPLAAALLLMAIPRPLAGQTPPIDARPLFERAMRYYGAEQARGVYAYREKYVQRSHDKQGEQVVTCDVLLALPDREQIECSNAQGKGTVVLSSAGAFGAVNGETRDMPPGWDTTLLANNRQSMFWVARLWHDGKLTVTAAGSDQVNGQNTQMLDISNGVETARWWIDPVSGRRLRRRTTMVDEKGARTDVVADYSDFRSVGGVIVPFHTEVESGGEHSTYDTQAMELNPPVDPRLFYRPPLLLDQVAFNPAPAPPAPLMVNGTLSVISQPTGAQLYVDDVAKGTTSESEGRLIVEDLAPGSHRLRVGATGYREWTKTVSVEPGDRVEVTATLERAGPPPFTENDVTAMLSGGVSPKRAAVLVGERGVDFALSDAAEQRLRQAGADDALLLAIAKAKK